MPISTLDPVLKYAFGNMGILAVTLNEPTVEYAEVLQFEPDCVLAADVFQSEVEHAEVG